MAGLRLAVADHAGRWAKPLAPDAPIAAILVLLASTIGLPFVVLAATSPLLQAWFARLRPGQSPFWLFALSNGGSLLGLLSYPLLVEPLLSVRVQGWLWSVAFAVYAGGVAWCAVIPRSDVSRGDEESAGPPADPSHADTAGRARGDRASVLYLALAFFPSVMLGAVTSHLTQEVAAVPFLWMVPLALYLLSFIVCFSWPDAGRAGWRVALAVAAGLAVFGLHGELMMKVPPRIVMWCGVLFVYAMAGHGELARRRPEPPGLTGYYLAIAAGGALGGLLNAVVAPLLFTGYWELHLGILAGPLVVLMATATADSSSPATDEAPRNDRDRDDAPRGDSDRRRQRDSCGSRPCWRSWHWAGPCSGMRCARSAVSCSPPAGSTACCASCARRRASRTST